MPKRDINITKEMLQNIFEMKGNDLEKAAAKARSKESLINK